MLKIYRMPNGRTYQFEESEAPNDAVPVEAEKKAKPATKAARPANKSRKAATK